MKKLRILSDTLSSHTDAQKTTNQFVEIFPNLWNTDSNTPSLTVDTMFVGTNGSLIFQNTFSYHTGRYLCHVSNGIGHAIHQIVNVNVKGIHSSKFTFSCVVYLSPHTSSLTIRLSLLSFLVPPKIILDRELISHENTQLIRAAKGKENVELKCHAVGDTPITVKWTKVITLNEISIFVLS